MEFVFIEDKNFREKILSKVNGDPNNEQVSSQDINFDLDDEYITSNDIIMKVNVSENSIHVWSMNPQFETTSFRDKITKI